MPDIPLASHSGGVVLPVLVVPGASRTEIAGPHGETLRVRVAAAPEKGRANRALEALLGGFFETKATLLSGGQGRSKRILLHSLTPAQVSDRIEREWG
jgi:hypothetical protein